LEALLEGEGGGGGGKVCPSASDLSRMKSNEKKIFIADMFFINEKSL
jgi:hypothetical protein